MCNIFIQYILYNTMYCIIQYYIVYTIVCKLYSVTYIVLHTNHISRKKIKKSQQTSEDLGLNL